MLNARWILLLLAFGCGDDGGRVPAVATTIVRAVQHQHCLPSALQGAGVLEAPQRTDVGGRDEIGATYTDGDGVVRVIAVLYRDDAEIATERAAETALLEACEGRPDCERGTVGGASARTVSLDPVGQESTNLFIDPGVRLSVIASPGRSAVFAELVDLDCLRGAVQH